MWEYDLQASAIPEDDQETREIVQTMRSSADEVEQTRITIIDVLDFGH